MPAYGIAIRNRSLNSNHGLLCWKDFLTAETLNVISRDLCGRGNYYVNCNVPELNLKPSRAVVICGVEEKKTIEVCTPVTPHGYGNFDS